MPEQTPNTTRHSYSPASASDKTWLDVCLKNVVIFLVAAKHLGFDPNIIWAALRRATNEVSSWSRERLAKTWLALGAYQTIEDSVIETTGHAYHLIEVGRFSPEASFGLSETLEKFMLKSMIRYITSPRVAVRQVAIATRGFTQNKQIWFVVDEPDHAVLQVIYPDGPGGIRRRASSDYRSLLFWIRGVLESLAPIWPWQAKIGAVKYLTVNVRPDIIIKREWPEAEVEIRDNHLLVNGEEYGHIVHLIPETDSGALLGRYKNEADKTTIPAFLISKDVVTRCMVSGQMLPILRAGEIHCFNNNIPTNIELRWTTNWWFKLMERIPGLLKPLEHGMTQEERMANAEMMAAVAAAERSLLEKVVERQAPTKKVAHDLISGDYQERTLKSLVLLLDIKGYTTLAARLGGRGTVALLKQTSAAFKHVARDEFGFWPYKRMGDGLIVVWAPWDRYPDENDPYRSATEAVRAMLDCQRRLHEEAEKLGIKLRIGIVYNYVTWADLNVEKDMDTSVEFEGCTGALDEVSRFEAYGAAPGTTAVSKSVVELLHPELHEMTPHPATLGDFVYHGAMPEKDGKSIEVWRIKNE